LRSPQQPARTQRLQTRYAWNGMIQQLGDEGNPLSHHSHEPTFQLTGSISAIGPPRQHNLPGRTAAQGSRAALTGRAKVCLYVTARESR
jgi:hypothetical protein